MLYLAIAIGVVLIAGIAFYFRKPKKRPLEREDVTLLIIGPPSCGKTAIIYFLYRFASNYLTDKRDVIKEKPVATGESSEAPSIKKIGNQSPVIKDIELGSFVNQIIRETITSKDFMGTETDSVTCISHDTGLLNLKIYNISGELFSNTIKNEQTIKALAAHLENENADKTFCILADETNKSTGEDYNISWDGVDAFFSANGLRTSQHIFANIKNNVNVLRVVTKFDNIHPTKDPAIKNSKKNADFAIVQKAIYDLNHHESINSMKHHLISYPVPQPTQFSGTESMKFWKQFICTGLYDKTNFSNDIYEIEEVSKKVLKPVYRGNGLNRLEMYGIGEIFIFMLGRIAKFRQNEHVTPGNEGRLPGEKLSNEDYKKILRYN